MKNRILLFVLSFLACQLNAQTPTNILFNPSFEAPEVAVGPNGEHYTGTSTFNGWKMTGSNTPTFTIIRPNGNYGPGPNTAQDGNQCIEVFYNSGTVYQDFELSNTTEITFGGYFSGRGGATLNEYVQIFSNPSGASYGTLVSTSTVVTFSGNKTWHKTEGVVTLPAGKYRYAAPIDDAANFDAAYALGVDVTLPCIWDGTVGNWSDHTKWTCGHVPTVADDAFIYNGTITLNVPATALSLTLTDGILTGTNNISVVNTLVWSGGTINTSSTMTVGGTADISNTINTPTLETGSLMLNGLVTFSGQSTFQNNATLTMKGGATLEGTINIEDNATMILPATKTLTINANNYAVIQGSGSVGTTFGTFVNNGIIVKNGTGLFNITRAKLTNTGTINVNAGGIEIYNDGFYNFTNSHTGATFNIGNNADYAEHNNTNTFTNCTFNGTTTGIGTFLLSGNSTFVSENAIETKFSLSNGLLILNQDISLTDANILGTVNGTGTLTIPTGGDVTCGGTFNIPIINQGILTASGTTNNTLLNDGTLDVSGGLITNNTFTNQARLKLGYLTVNNAFVNSNTGIISSSGIYNNLDLTNATTVTNTGTIAPGSVDASAPIGLLTMTPFVNTTSTLAVQLAGIYTNPTNGFDQVNVQSAVTLSGTLNLSFINGYTPSVNDEFVIMTCTGGCSGNFSNIVHPGDNLNAWEIDVTTNPNEVHLKMKQPLFYSQLCTFIDATNVGNWSEGIKWSCGHAPTTGNWVTINTGATVTIDVADVHIAGMTLNSCTLTGDNSIFLTETFTWNGGTLSGTGTMAVGKNTTITNAPTLDTRTLRLSRMNTIEGGFNTNNNAILEIQNQSSLTCTTNTNTAWSGNGSIIYINGGGTFIKKGIGTLELNGQRFVATSFSKTQIEAGILRLGFGGNYDNTTFILAANTFLTLKNGTHSFSNSQIWGTGGFAVIENANVSTFINNSVVSTLSNFNLGGASTFNLGQELNLNAFGYFSTNALTGTGNIAANTMSISNGTVNFIGNLTASIMTISGGVITNTGNLTANNTMTVNTGTIGNIGDLIASTMTINAGTISNTGNLTANAITINAGIISNTGDVIVNGDLSFNGGTIAGIGELTVNGSTILIGGGTVARTFTNQATRKIKGNGTLNTTGGTFTNNGIISPGNSTGQIIVNPTFTNPESGTLEMEFINTGTLTAPNLSWDFISSTGNIQLSGTLSLLITGSIPVGGYTILQSTGGTVSGVFTSVSYNGGALPANISIRNISNVVVLFFSAALPVELLDFKAQNTEGGNLLTWQTAMEQNVSHFDIERSGDGKVFKK